MEMHFCFVVLAVFLGGVSSNGLKFLPASLQRGVVDLKDGKCTSTSPTTASCCVKAQNHTVCVRMKFEPPDNISERATIDDQFAFGYSFNQFHPSHACGAFRGMWICTDLYNVQHIKDISFSACIKMDVNEASTEEHLKLGCFKLSIKPGGSVFSLLFERLDEEREPPSSL